jgi:hypothetical protein
MTEQDKTPTTTQNNGYSTTLVSGKLKNNFIKKIIENTINAK